MQTNDIPPGLYETGVKQGDEFDANDYFDVLPNLSMQDGYVLDYTYLADSLGAFPLLTARSTELPPYKTRADVPDAELENYWKYVEIKDVEQGYFEFTAFIILADQFYLSWHANYNDAEIVCNRAGVDAISNETNSGDFGMEFDNEQMSQIQALNNIEPLVKLTDTTAIVEIITFSKWGGLYRTTYVIDRSFPHIIIDAQQENIVPYNCGIMF
jgi:hypothetical protein